MTNNIKSLFNVGDQVNILSINKTGTIKEVISLIGEGDNTYLVNVDGKDRMYIESNMKLFREKLRLGHVDIDELGYIVEIEDRMDEIIRGLGLIKPISSLDELSNACKLQKFLTLMIENEDKKEINTSNNNLKILYDGLINGIYDYVNYSCIFSSILKRLGMQVYNVNIEDEDKNFYMSNLVYIDGKFYFFDSFLEKEIYLESSDGECILCCAGIGLNRYSQFFNPVGILEFGKDSKKGELPKNISMDDIDMELINSL